MNNRCNKVDEGNNFKVGDFAKEDMVWCHDALMDSSKMDKFNPRWRRPYMLETQLSRTLWKVKHMNIGRTRGRRPRSLYHVDQVRPYLQRIDSEFFIGR